MTNDDGPIPELMVSPLKPVLISIEQARLHPLLRHALVDERVCVQWPSLTERQKQVVADTVRLVRVDGRKYFSMPPRVNADWFLPENPTPDDLRTFYGSMPDLQRWYLSIPLTAGARDALLVTTLTVDGQRAFFTCSPGSGWARISARIFTSCRDSSDFMLVAVDRLIAAQWRREWNSAADIPRRRDVQPEHFAPPERPGPRMKAYWQAEHAKVTRMIEVIDLDLLVDPDADRDALKKRRQRLAWHRWNISKRLAGLG